VEVALIGDGVHDLLINLVATFPNGTSFTINALAMRAVVVTGGHGSSGSSLIWEQTGLGRRIRRDMRP
jgi:hypothetical protein